jgi:hypothetical protein
VSLPKTVYVSERVLSDDTYLECSRKQDEAIEDDGPTVIGVYKLVEVLTLRKAVQVVKR